MAKFSFFCLLTSLALAALTGAVPGTVYRADPRNPDKIKATGGFKSFGSLQDITVAEHVRKLYNKPHRQGQDPWISTSAWSGIGTLSTVDKPCWIYTIDTNGISTSFTDVAAAFKAAQQKNPHPEEEEWAAKLEIPLAHITSFYRLAADGKHSITYTWETWAKRSTKGSTSSSSLGKKMLRDDIRVLKKAGSPGAAAAITA